MYRIEINHAMNRDAKNMFFSNHVFYAKKKVFFIEKNSFLMFFFVFFQLQEDF